VKKSALISEMPSEPDWSASISSASVCTWFYVLAILNGVFAVAGVLGAVMLLSRGTKSAASLLPLVLGSLVGFTNAWFMFIVCNRGINTEGFGWKTNLAKSAFSVATGGKYGI
jgi:hypothetical protein